MAQAFYDKNKNSYHVGPNSTASFGNAEYIRLGKEHERVVEKKQNLVDSQERHIRALYEYILLLQEDRARLSRLCQMLQETQTEACQ